MKQIEKGIYSLCRFMGVFCYAGLIFMMLFITVDVVLRYVFKSPILGSYEIVERVLSITVFSSLAYTQQQKGHLHVTLFLRMMPHKAAFVVFGFFLLLSSIGSAVISYCAYLGAMTATAKGYITVILRIPMAPFYWIQLVMMAVFSLVLFMDAVKAFLAVFKKNLGEEVVAGWN